MAKEKLNREPLENKIWEYLEKDRHPLEYFTDLDYFLAGAEEIWDAASRRLRKMPNYELLGIYNNIIAEENGEWFDSYYDIFRYDYLDNIREYEVKETLVRTTTVKAKTNADAILAAKSILNNMDEIEYRNYSTTRINTQ